MLVFRCFIAASTADRRYRRLRPIAAAGRIYDTRTYLDDGRVMDFAGPGYEAHVTGNQSLSSPSIPSASRSSTRRSSRDKNRLQPHNINCK